MAIAMNLVVQFGVKNKPTTPPIIWLMTEWHFALGLLNS